MEIKRTFEFIEYALENYPKDDGFSVKRNGQWEKFSTQTIKQKADYFSSGLISLGFQKGDKIVTISNNRPEWNIADIGMAQIGVIHVPIYPTMGTSEYDHIIRHSDAKIIIIAKPEHYQRIANANVIIEENLEIYSFDKTEAPNLFNDILKIGEENFEQNTGKFQQMRADITENDICSIIYTSGTTGTPKGVMLTHKNFVTNVLAQEVVVPEGVNKAISFLPLNHVFERTVNLLLIYSGVSIYYAESTETLVDDILEVKPETFTTVPRLLEKIYDKIYEKGRDLKGIKKGIFFSSLRSAQKYEGSKSPGLLLKAKLAFDNKMVFDKWREALGGNIKIIVSGGAALQPRLARVFNAAKIPVCEGYGLTETSPIIAAMIPGMLKLYSTGPALHGNQIKIQDPDPDSGVGEIWTKGPNVMLGYYKDPERTAEVLTEDGWFKTGDLGVLDEDGYLFIKGRIKNMILGPSGENIYPEQIEAILNNFDCIEESLVYDDHEKIVARVFLNYEELDKKFGINHLSETKVKEKIKELLETIRNKTNEQLAAYSRISKIIEQTEPFEKTPTQKTKRYLYVDRE